MSAARPVGEPGIASGADVDAVPEAPPPGADPRQRGSGRPPLGPNARAALPGLGALHLLRAAGTVLFSLGLAVLLTGLAQAGLAGLSDPADVGPLPEYIGTRALRDDALLPGLGGSWAPGGFPGTRFGAALAVAVGGLLLRAAGDWLLGVLARRAARGAQTELRERLLRRELRGGSLGAGGAAVLITRGLDALDDYYTRSVTAMVGTGVVPVVLLGAVALVDPISALVLVLTLPLVPVFMVLIGKTTQRDTRRAQAGLLRLSSHLAELARGLPVLVGLNRDRAQRRALAELGERYRRTTMATLRSAFLSSLALELITTLSVAVVAVTIGVRLVRGDLGLDTGLLVLLLAPECFQPLRDLGTAYHQSQDGVEALRRTEEILADRSSAPEAASTADRGDRAAGRAGSRADQAGRGVGPEAGAAPVLRISDLTVTYPDRSAAALTRVELTAASGQITAVTGASGAGKSTLLRAAADLLPEGTRTTGTIRVDGSVAWIGQDPRFLAGTAAAEAALYACPQQARHWLTGGRDAADDAAQPRVETRARETAAAQALALAPVRTALAQLGLLEVAAVPPAALSAGQQRRLAIARVLARLRAGDRGDGGRESALVLVDEPTAHLDPEAAEAVLSSLRHLAQAGAAVVVVTHSPRVRRLADALVHLDAEGATRTENGTLREPAAGSHGEDHAGPAAHRSGTPARQIDDGGSRGLGTEPAAPASPEPGPGDEARRRPRVREVLTVLRRVTGLRLRSLLGAVALNTLTVLAGAALTALSGWLIVRAAQQPGLMYLLVAITGVRFFGLARAVLRYSERLRTHDLVLRAADALRLRTWTATGGTALGLRSLLTGRTFLRRLIADVDDLRDAMPRVLLPAAAAVPVLAAAVLVTALCVPQAVWLVAAAALVSLTLIPALTLRADAAGEETQRSERARALGLAAGTVEAREDLRGNGLAASVLAVFRDADAAAHAAARRAAWATGLGAGAQLLVWWGAAVGVVALAWQPVASGDLSAPVAAIPVLLATALVEPMSAATEAIRAWPAFARLALRAAEHAAGAPDAAEHAAEDASDPQGRAPEPREELAGLALEEVAARWPGMDRPAVRHLSGTVFRGGWLGITGPSGSGKSTALAVLLGFLPAESGSIRRLAPGAADDPREPLTPAQLRGVAAWCPQEAYVFDSTVRGNLALAREREHPPTETQLAAALERAGLAETVAALPRGLDTRVGPGGSLLSGGQRQRLAVARALLTGAPLLYLDEPTAHLDEPTARRMMRQLAAGLGSGLGVGETGGRPVPGVIVISHRPEDLTPCRRVVTLTPVERHAP